MVAHTTDLYLSQYEIVYSPNKYRETEGIKEREQDGHKHGNDPVRLSGIRQAELHDKQSNVRCMSDYAVSVRERYQRCATEKAAGNGRMRQLR